MEGMRTTPTSLDEDLINILSEAVADMGLECLVPKQPVKKWMNGSYLNGRVASL